MVRSIALLTLLCLPLTAQAFAPGKPGAAPQPRPLWLDSSGDAIDAHDGKLERFGDTYYLYGTSYSCGFEWQVKQPSCCGRSILTPFCAGVWQSAQRSPFSRAGACGLKLTSAKGERRASTLAFDGSGKLSK